MWQVLEIAFLTTYRLLQICIVKSLVQAALKGAKVMNEKKY